MAVSDGVRQQDKPSVLAKCRLLCILHCTFAGLSRTVLDLHSEHLPLTASSDGQGHLHIPVAAYRLIAVVGWTWGSNGCPIFSAVTHKKSGFVI